LRVAGLLNQSHQLSVPEKYRRIIIIEKAFIEQAFIQISNEFAAVSILTILSGVFFRFLPDSICGLRGTSPEDGIGYLPA
jgi:hypothetical protein